jgi:hypothetical protein
MNHSCNGLAVDVVLAEAVITEHREHSGTQAPIAHVRPAADLTFVRLGLVLFSRFTWRPPACNLWFTPMPHRSGFIKPNSLSRRNEVV